MQQIFLGLSFAAVLAFGAAALTEPAAPYSSQQEYEAQQRQYLNAQAQYRQPLGV